MRVPGAVAVAAAAAGRLNPIRNRSAGFAAGASFEAPSANHSGIAALGMVALKRYHGTDESREGVAALKQERKPEFRKHVR